MVSQYVLGFGAGGLSLLAPCVLPLLPLIVASSLKSSRWGPLLSALGLTLSFTLFGILTSVFASTLDPEVLRQVGATILVIVGLVFIIPSLKIISAARMQNVSDVGIKLQSKIALGNPLGEFLGGALLGLIWSPCTGPTLAIAVGLASQSQNLLHATLVFLFFGLGAGLGLVSLGLLIKRFVFLRAKLARLGSVLNAFAGATSLAIGLLILTGREGDVQEFLLSVMPSWLVRLTVSI